MVTHNNAGSRGPKVTKVGVRLGLAGLLFFFLETGH